MLLKNLIKKYPQGKGGLIIKGLAINSKKVKKGFIFFALRGAKNNGEKYIKEAVRNGAVIIVCSTDCDFKSNNLCVIKRKKVRDFLGEVVSKYYKKKPKQIIAVTGTNGKSSVADFFYQLLNNNKIPVASIGTLGIKFKKKFKPLHLTSPDIITLHKNLQFLKKKNIDHVIIEASSHGLSQKRLNNLKFKAGIFTNLSQDHLDYHKTMKNYLKSKLILFSKLLLKNRYIISDSNIKQYKILKKIAKKNNLKILDINKITNSIPNDILPLVGNFQVKNLAMAILAAKICKLKNYNINKALKKLKTVDGRLELVKNFPNGVKVFVDYAHTPDALSEAISALKAKYNNNISLVFGCGGERDTHKRPMMAKIAKNLCSKIYVTDDNPRKESPKKIRKSLTKYLKNSNYFEISDRSKAISMAINNAYPNEIVLIAGKGHEATQDYGNKVLYFSDKKTVKNFVVKKSISKQNYNFNLNEKIMHQIIKNKNRKYEINNIALDSRDIKKNDLFLALRGKKDDGNKYISQSIKKGTSCIISSKKNKNKKVVKVPNPKLFLNKFAELKRKKINFPIIAITGSAGKTSLKNLLSSILQKIGSTYASPKSFNNHLGVPISVSNLSPYNKFGILEVGMSKKGEINALSKIIKPNIAIITNIAEAHIENFKSLKGIAKAKGEIINNIQKNGTLILNRDDKFFKYLSNKAKSKKLKIISFGVSKKSDIMFLNNKLVKRKEKIIVSIYGKKLEIKIRNVNIYNVLASLAVLKELNIKYDNILKTYEQVEPSIGRGKIHEVKRYNKKFKLIDESYNANPLSFKNALKNLSKIKKIKKSKKYLIIGDMLELGKNSNIYHKELSKLINKSDIDKVFVKGEKTLFTYKNLKKEKRGNIFQCNSDADLILRNIIAQNDYLMIKGSNATGLYNISNSMIKGS